MNRRKDESVIERAYTDAILHSGAKTGLARLERSLASMTLAATVNYQDSHWWMSFLLDRIYSINRDRRVLRRALYWTKRAARNGDATALYSMGMRYLGGEGVRRNISRAIEYLSAAAQAGDGEAAAEAGHALLHDMPPTRANRRKAIALLRLRVESGSALGACALGWAYCMGVGVRRDQHRAISLYRLAARRGSDHAMWNLSLCYENGTGVSKNGSRSRFWLRRAAEAGNIDAIETIRQQEETK